MLRRVAVLRAFPRAYSTKAADLASSAKAPVSNSYVQSDLTVNKYTERPVPLNVKLTHLQPIKLPTTHNNLVAEVTVASFFGLKDVEFMADYLLRAAFYLGIPAKGPTPMPGKVKRWTVIRSPFVHAKSKENWERRTYRRQIKLYDANPEVVQIFLAVAAKHSLAGVGVKATTYTSESLDSVEEMDVATKSDMENPLAMNKVDLDTQNGELAQAVLDLLADPKFSGNEEVKAQVEEQLKK